MERRAKVQSHPLVVLLLLDLLHLVQQLSHPQLQLRQLVFGCDLRVVVGVLAHLDIQVHSLQQQEHSITLTGTSHLN